MTNRITDIPVPKALYKYRDWNNKLHRRIISKQEIYFAKPSEFNDPFDGNIPVRWDLMTYEDCVNKNMEILNIRHKNKDQNLVRKEAERITAEKTLWHPEKMVKEGSEQIAKWKSILGLFSLSSIPDNILMWSHYSNNHTGFLVGLKTNSLIQDCDSDFIEPITYQKQYPLISGDDDVTQQFYKKFFSKSDLWSYEEEWRISKNHIQNRVVKLKKNTIVQVILGCRMNARDEERIINLCDRSLSQNIRISKAVMDENNFSLNLVGLNT